MDYVGRFFAFQIWTVVLKNQIQIWLIKGITLSSRFQNCSHLYVIATIQKHFPGPKVKRQKHRTVKEERGFPFLPEEKGEHRLE